MPKKISDTHSWIVDDLDSVTDFGQGECDPHEVGLTQDKVEQIWRRVSDIYATGAYPGVSFCLRKGGKIVLNRALGHARGNGPKETQFGVKTPMTVNTPVCLFSASKAPTALAAHKLAELGSIDLDAPVADYIEEFGQHGKGHITISQVLGHRAGIPVFDLPKEELKPELLLEWDRVIELLSETPCPNFVGDMAYHAITGGFIIGEIVKRTTGEDIREFMRKQFQEPMGMEFFNYGLRPEQRGQNAVNYVSGTPVVFPLSALVEEALGAPFDDVVEFSNSGAFQEMIVPAGNMFGTAEELSRFYQMMLDDGMYNGQQICQPETIKRAITPGDGISIDRILKAPMRFSEGFMMGMNPAGMYGPMTGSAWGHLGFMHIFGWASPRHDVSCGLMTTGKSLLGPSVLPIASLLTTIAWHCRPSYRRTKYRQPS